MRGRYVDYVDYVGYVGYFGYFGSIADYTVSAWGMHGKSTQI